MAKAVRAFFVLKGRTRSTTSSKPHTEFRRGNGLFSGFHFGMDDWGNGFNHGWTRINTDFYPEGISSFSPALRGTSHAGYPELRSWGARPPRALPDAPSRPAVARDAGTAAWNCFGALDVFREGAKTAPEAGALPFHFGIRVDGLRGMLYCGVKNETSSCPVQENEQARQRLNEVRGALLDLHKVLLASERASYEQAFGKIGSSHRFLQLLTDDPWFAWLQLIPGSSPRLMSGWMTRSR